jgi:hypothetical protein
MIWYAVDVNSVPSIFWSTICDIDEALDYINFPSDSDGTAQLVENWARIEKKSMDLLQTRALHLLLTVL